MLVPCGSLSLSRMHTRARARAHTHTHTHTHKPCFVSGDQKGTESVVGGKKAGYQVMNYMVRCVQEVARHT